VPTAAKILIMLFRLVWLLGLAVGIWIWTGHGYATLNTHIALGFCTVLLLAIIAVLGIVARASLVHILVAGFWIILLPVVGFGQLRWMPGAQHWLLRVLHLLIGILAIGSAEMLAGKAKRNAATPAL